jgi:hypothetical protein
MLVITHSTMMMLFVMYVLVGSIIKFMKHTQFVVCYVHHVIRLDTTAKRKEVLIWVIILIIVELEGTFLVLERSRFLGELSTEKTSP